MLEYVAEDVGQTVVTNIPADLLRDVLRIVHLYDAEGQDLLKRFEEAEAADNAISGRADTLEETDSDYDEIMEANQHSRAHLAGVAYELDLRRALLPLEPSSEMRSVLESLTFVGIILLAQAADILDVGVVMDLCGMAVASFYYPRDLTLHVLRDDILSAIRTNQSFQIVAEWPLSRRFDNPALRDALNAVMETEDVNVDVRAGLLAVSQHMFRKMESRRFHGNGGY